MDLEVERLSDSAMRTVVQRPTASNFQNLGYLGKTFQALKAWNLKFQGAKH